MSDIPILTDAEKARELDWLLRVTGMPSANALATLLEGQQRVVRWVRSNNIRVRLP